MLVLEGKSYLTITEATRELKITPWGGRTAFHDGRITAVKLDETSHTKLIARAEVERYKDEHLGRHGKRKQRDEVLTEQQRKQRAYQHAYYQRRKAARERDAGPRASAAHVHQQLAEPADQEPPEG
jgi:hypothetical protein